METQTPLLADASGQPDLSGPVLIVQKTNPDSWYQPIQELALYDELFSYAPRATLRHATELRQVRKRALIMFLVGVVIPIVALVNVGSNIFSANLIRRRSAALSALYLTLCGFIVLVLVLEA